MFEIEVKRGSFCVEKCCYCRFLIAERCFVVNSYSLILKSSSKENDPIKNIQIKQLSSQNTSDSKQKSQIYTNWRHKNHCSCKTVFLTIFHKSFSISIQSTFDLSVKKIEKMYNILPAQFFLHP